jgi:hypothetical protein
MCHERGSQSQEGPICSRGDQRPETHLRMGYKYLLTCGESRTGWNQNPTECGRPTEFASKKPFVDHPQKLLITVFFSVNRTTLLDLPPTGIEFASE